MENIINAKNELQVDGNTTLCKLREIADWQLNAKEAKVGLPALQRGYVWKPKQVETLWDSLLRGFPIGSFLVVENREIKKDLLDGQQRATAIAMGYYNPWITDKIPEFFSLKSVPVLWLDINANKQIQKGENKNFFFLPRIVTQSHPWGYRLDGGTLDLSDRRNAMKIYDDKGTYPLYNLTNVYPWKADMPVPMAFLIQVNSNINWKEELIAICKNHLAGIKLGNSAEPNYISKLETVLKDNEVCENIKYAITRLETTRIPIITLEHTTINKEPDDINEDSSTLFVRMNTSGSILGGEELIYSMYKTAFPKSKEIVEKAGTGFIAPSRIINHISRIVSTDLAFERNSNKDINIPQPLKLKQFKESIKESEFNENIRMLIDKNKLKNVESLFINLKNIFIGNKNYQLPLPLVVDIARANPDILFVLLYWLYKTESTIEDILKDDNLHRKILATITILTWFSFDIKKATPLNELAKGDLLKEGKKEFWDSAKIKALIENKIIVNLPKLDKEQKVLDQKFLKESNESEPIEGFRKNLLNQRGLLLFVQREYINKKFYQLQWDVLIEDSNRPYDWDHIYPSVYNQRGTNQELRNIYNTIGNLRAWALSDNRSDGKDLPSKKFGIIEDNKKNSFIKDNDWPLWDKISRSRITNNDENEAKNACNAIYTRIGNIYKEWYDTLSVGELLE